jgi:hypothetical protein
MSRVAKIVLCLVITAGLPRALSGAEPQPKRPAVETRPLGSLELADFTARKAVKSVAPEHPGVRVAADRAGVRIDFPPQEALPSARLWQADGKNADWSAFDYLRLSVANRGTVRTTLWFYFHDEAAAQAGRQGAFGLAVDLGERVEVAVPLGHFHRADGSGTLDLARMRSLRVAFERQAAPGQVVIDRLTLVRILDGPTPFFYFDFHGPGGAPVLGTLPVTPATAYARQTGYGFTDTKDLAPTLRAAGKFPVFSTGIGGKKVSFAVDVPNGRYEVQAVAMAFTWDGVRCFNYRIDAEGREVVNVPLTEEVFYSGRGLSWGVDRFHDPTRTLWAQYGRDYFTTHTFQADVADGQLNLDFHDGAVYAAWIYPAAQAAAGRARVEAVQGEQDWRVRTSIARVADAPDAGEPLEPDAEAKSRGYLLFARPYTLRVYPNRNPRPDELVRRLAVALAPGEYEPATFAIRPLKDLRNVTVEVTDLAGPGGAVLPRAAVRLDIVKYFPLKRGAIDYVLTPSYLFPCRPLDLPKDFNRQYWLTIHAAADRAPGTYTGTVRVRCEGGGASDLGLEVRVYPLALAESPRAHGFWNSRAPNYQVVRLFPDRADALARQVAEAEFTDMVAHGVTGVSLPPPVFQSVDPDGGNLKLDWAEARLYADLVKQFGLQAHEHLSGGGNTVDVLLKRGFKEFSPAFDRAYLDLLRQTAAFWKDQGLRVVFQVTDEPRETDLNSWNRNRADTIRYLRLTRQVPDLRFMVNPMADTDGFGNPYTVLIPLLDVCATHSWPESVRTIFLCGKEKLADLWFYNDGVDRFPWGFHLWKSAALADFEWVYAWEARGAPPLIDDEIGIGDSVVPWAKGVLPKINYEWAREGVDDLRYLATLERAVAGAPADGPAAEAAREARDFLAALRKAVPDYPETELVTGAEAGAKYSEGGVRPHLEAWRRQIAEYLLAIRAGAKAARVPEAWAALPQRASDQAKTAVCLLVDRAPRIDGALDDAAWQAAPVQTDFISTATGEPSALGTEVRIVSDGKSVYFAFHCVEPKYGELRTYATERDSDVWQDDAVELFLDTTNDKTTYFQVIVNSLGTIQDSQTRDGAWNGDVRTAVRKGKGFWDVEIAVGLASMKARAGPDVTWGLNLCRDRQPEPHESASWTFVGHSFHNPAKFGTLEFAKGK